MWVMQRLLALAGAVAGTVVALGVLVAGAQVPQIDPRTAATDMLAMQAQVMALQAHLRAGKEDAEAVRAKLCGMVAVRAEPVAECAEAKK